ncbi:MAG: hypothetical protein J5980_04260 [Muribaculaceae bacterium]|nr:hypothetical protein [Muribaculaceae bacterium]
MERTTFEQCIDRHYEAIEQIRQAAHELHRAVNQTYGQGLPYAVHLDMVASQVISHGHEVCASEHDVLPMVFGAYFHDSIEDARQTYNDVTRLARQWMDDEQAHMAAEIVYALTNDKGRTRAERAGERYYQGIRQTPYAPLVKLADRVANMTYSATHDNADNVHMREVYRRELPHFLEAITAHDDDIRLALPQALLATL